MGVGPGVVAGARALVLRQGQCLCLVLALSLVLGLWLVTRLLLGPVLWLGLGLLRLGAWGWG